MSQPHARQQPHDRQPLLLLLLLQLVAHLHCCAWLCLSPCLACPSAHTEIQAPGHLQASRSAHATTLHSTGIPSATAVRLKDPVAHIAWYYLAAAADRVSHSRMVRLRVAHRLASHCQSVFERPLVARCKGCCDGKYCHSMLLMTSLRTHHWVVLHCSLWSSTHPAGVASNKQWRTSSCLATSQHSMVITASESTVDRGAAVLGCRGAFCQACSCPARARTQLACIKQYTWYVTS